MMYELVDEILGWFLFACILCLFAMMAVDITQDYRSFDAQVACREQRMEPARRAFSTTVTCVPALMRNDTTTVNLP